MVAGAGRQDGSAISGRQGSLALATDSNGKKPASVSAINHAHERVRDVLEMPKEFVPHSFRHTFGTRLGEAGADAFTIMRNMGHSSITVSQRYVHPTSATMENAIMGLERATEAAPKPLRLSDESDFLFPDACHYRSMHVKTSPSSVPKKSPVKPIKGVYEKVPGSGVWWIRYADHTGRIRREKAGSRSSATALYQKRKTEVLEGRKFPERLRRRAVYFASLAEDALEYSKAHKLSFAHDEYRMRKLVAQFGKRTAESITPQDIERWLNQEAKENCWKPATVNRFKALLSLTFRLGVENGKVESNPARLVRRRREDNGRIRWLGQAEEKRLRDVVIAHFSHHLPELELALNTGIRRSEQYRLTWECVDLERQLLTIPQTKNGQTRHVPMNSVTVTALRALRRRSIGSGPVFVGRGGERLSSPRHWFEDAVRLAAISDFTWHCLRHTFASRLVMAGVDLRTVQELMGHKTISMTCRYAHLAPSHKLAAVERLVKPSEFETGTGTGTEDMVKDTTGQDMSM